MFGEALGLLSEPIPGYSHELQQRMPQYLTGLQRIVDSLGWEPCQMQRHPTDKAVWRSYILHPGSYCANMEFETLRVQGSLPRQKASITQQVQKEVVIGKCRGLAHLWGYPSVPHLGSRELTFELRTTVL